MRTLRRQAALFAAAALNAVATAGAQEVDPYASTIHFGTGLINTPVAWVSPRTADTWLSLTAKDLPSFSDPGRQGIASRLNTNLAFDSHWLGRISLGVSLYSQNPEWGGFGQVLLLREGELGPLPSIAVGARNIGKYKREDRMLIGHDIALDSTGSYGEIVDDRYQDFDTSPTLYAVATKHFRFSSSPEGGSSLGLSVGYGNGLFSEDGGLGDQYNNGGTIASGLFLGGRFVTRPTLNSTLTFMAENDGWDWNAGVVWDWRGVTLGVYGTELEAGGRDGADEGFNVYNYTKINFLVGYSANIRNIARGVVLRTRITELEREQQRLRVEIANRERRIDRLEVALRGAQTSELANIERRRAELEAQVQAEREAIRRAGERLRELEAGRPPVRPPSTTPPSSPPPTTPPER